MTGKMRVYQIAKEVGLPNKQLISKIRALGLEVNNHMSSLDAEDVQRVKRALEKDRVANTETKRLSSTVLRRRSKGGRKVVTTGGAAEAPAEPTPEPPAPPPAAAKPAPARQPERKRVVAAKPAEPAPPPVEAKPKVRKRKPEPVVEAAPAAKAAPPPQPKPAPAPKPAPEPAPAPVKSAPAPTPEPKPMPKPEPKPEPKPAPAPEPSTPVVVAGPKVVDIPGRKRKQAPAPEPAKAAAKPARPKPAASAKPTVRRQVPKAKSKPMSARDRFEAELARARERAAEREAERAAKAAAKRAPVDDPDRDPSRPAVGSVISLPVPRIKITERAPTRSVPGQGQIRGRFQQQRGRGGGRRGRDFRKKEKKKGQGRQTQITTPAEHKRVIRMEDTIAIPDLAKNMGIKANEVLRKLWSQGMMGININASIDFDTAQIIAGEFGYEVQNVAFKEDDVFTSQEDQPEDLVQRAPVVTVMGHVDHGKTSLLDAIRETNVTRGESGGITQHIAAYRVDAGGDHGDIVFLDTPGHEAFTEMRARGAQSTDIVVLVCAANDGVMPQTIEALQHAKAAEVQIIVAVNKIDLPDANPEKVKQQLAEHGLIPEEWGGDTLYIEVSALKKTGIEDLLGAISLTAEVLELKANPNKTALGIIIEASLDRSRGPMATVLIQEGTLRTGDIVVAGEFYGKVRAILDHRAKPLKEAGPSTPVQLLGLDGVPLAGETLNVADDEKVAKQVVEHRREAKRRKELAKSGKISLENIMERIQEGDVKELKIVLKTDVQGSAEAIKESLVKLSTEKVGVSVISAGVGGITESDVNLAKAGGAVIIGFHVRPAGKSAKLAEREGVDIQLFDVIYEAIDAVRAGMAGLLAPIKREQEQGRLEVRDTFRIPRRGTVAGCMVTDGLVQRKSLLRVVRDAVQIYEGRVGSLKRFKEDAGEVKQGFECGLMIEGFNDIAVGDIIEAYEIVEEAATL